MKIASERDLYSPVLLYMERRRWIGSGSLIAEEVPLSGRRVDCAILTRSGRLLAIEFKLSDFGRALWQATLNTHFFDRSLMAVNARASVDAVERARSAGVELIARRESTYTRSAPAEWNRPPHVIRQRVISKICSRGVAWEDYVRRL